MRKSLLNTGRFANLAKNWRDVVRELHWNRSPEFRCSTGPTWPVDPEKRLTLAVRWPQSYQWDKAASYADRIVFLKDGRIVGEMKLDKSRDPQEILKRLAQLET